MSTLEQVKAAEKVMQEAQHSVFNYTQRLESSLDLKKYHGLAEAARKATHQYLRLVYDVYSKFEYRKEPRFARRQTMATCSTFTPTLAPDVESAVRQMTVDWANAFNRDDYHAVAALYTSDALFIPAHHDVARGPVAIAKAVAELAETGYTDLKIEVEWVHQSGEHAVSRGTYSCTIRGTDGTAIPERGRWLTATRLTESGLLFFEHKIQPEVALRASPEIPVVHPDIESAVRQMVTDWANAFNCGDYQAVAALYTSNALFIPAHHDVARGPIAIAKTVAELAEIGYTDLKVEVEWVHQSGEHALSKGTYSSTIRGTDGTSITERGRWLTAARLTESGLLFFEHKIQPDVALKPSAELTPFLSYRTVEVA